MTSGDTRVQRERFGNRVGVVRPDIEIGVVGTRGKKATTPRPAVSVSKGFCASQSNSPPESVDTASVTTKLIDDIKIIYPSSIPIKIFDFRLPPGIFANSPSKQTVMYCCLHDGGIQEASGSSVTWWLFFDKTSNLAGQKIWQFK